MAGVKRRSKYRKNVEASVLDELHEPEDGQIIVRVAGSRGSNLLEVVTETGETGLAMLPTKFRKLVWVKRGDHLIVDVADGDFERANGGGGQVRFAVAHVLYRDQVKHLKKIDKWPAAFADKDQSPHSDSEAAPAATAAADGGAEETKGGEETTSGGAGGASAAADAAASAESDDDADLWVNTNRRVAPDSDPEDYDDTSDEDSSDA